MDAVVHLLRIPGSAFSGFVVQKLSGRTCSTQPN